MEEKYREEHPHRLTMTGREKLTVTGVEDVESFEEDKIIAYTTEGIMTVRGAEFRIERLSVEDGELEIEGDIDCIEYAEGHKADKGGFFSRIFK